MAQFQYQILVANNAPNAPTGVVWFLNANKPLGPDLPQILNGMGSQGWQVVGIGDLGFGGRSEILLQKTI